MRRAEGLRAISRRDFCAFAGGLALAACTDGSTGVVRTGPLGGDDDQNGPDANNPPDGGLPSDSGPLPDGAVAGACVGAATDVGKTPSDIVANSPFYYSGSNVFIARDSGGLYALTARCTHEGATCIVDSGDFYCPRHGAQFTFNGAVISGPVVNPLSHYSLCIMPNGNLGVQTSMKVSASTRLVA
jgi:nitrite reductase/ring-hydroxylating ferredoxin subunit